MQESSLVASMFSAILVESAGLSQKLVNVIGAEVEVSSVLVENMRAQQELFKRGLKQPDIDVLLEMSKANPGRFDIFGPSPCVSLTASDVNDQSSDLAKALGDPFVGLYAATFARTHADFARFARDYGVPQEDLDAFDGAVKKDYHGLKAAVIGMHTCG
jgi:hypothetical protein